MLQSRETVVPGFVTKCWPFSIAVEWWSWRWWPGEGGGGWARENRTGNKFLVVVVATAPQTTIPVWEKRQQRNIWTTCMCWSDRQATTVNRHRTPKQSRVLKPQFTRCNAWPSRPHRSHPILPLHGPLATRSSLLRFSLIFREQRHLIGNATNHSLNPESIHTSSAAVTLWWPSTSANSLVFIPQIHRSNVAKARQVINQL